MIAVQVIPLIDDRFKKQEEAKKGEIQAGLSSASPHVRRPTRGIALKEETFATLRVVSGSGKNRLLVDSGSRRPNKDSPFEINGKRATDVYSNFLIQQVQEDRQEKSQILETFGEPYIFLFGERARIVSFSGVLLNTQDFNWEAEWWHNYENYLRGTQCVRNDARVFLSYDETLVSGYILGAAAAKNTQEPNHINFQFQLFVTSYVNFSRVGDPRAMKDSEVQAGSYANSFEGTLSEEAASALRPKLVSNTPSNLRLDDSGQAQMPSLVDGILSQGLTTVARTFQRAQKLANSVLSNISTTLNGMVVRVPVGFEGSMVFDEEMGVRIREVSYGGAVKYTTYSDNEDEYVGRGTHYGSSSVGLSSVTLPSTSVDSEREDAAKAVDKAREVWRGFGLEVPKDQERSISMLMSHKAGIISAGSAAAWLTKKGLSSSSSPRIRE